VRKTASAIKKTGSAIALLCHNVVPPLLAYLSCHVLG